MVTHDEIVAAGARLFQSLFFSPYSSLLINDRVKNADRVQQCFVQLSIPDYLHTYRSIFVQLWPRVYITTIVSTDLPYRVGGVHIQSL